MGLFVINVFCLGTLNPSKGFGSLYKYYSLSKIIKDFASCVILLETGIMRFRRFRHQSSKAPPPKFNFQHESHFKGASWKIELRIIPMLYDIFYALYLR